MSNNSTPYLIKGETTNGTLLSPDMSPRFERGYVSVIFYTDETQTTIVTPTDGTVTIEASESGTGFGTILNGTINAFDSSYKRPSFSGPVGKIRVTLAGISGAGFMVATISRYGGR